MTVRPGGTAVESVTGVGCTPPGGHLTACAQFPLYSSAGLRTVFDHSDTGTQTTDDHSKAETQTTDDDSEAETQTTDEH